MRIVLLSILVLVLVLVLAACSRHEPNQFQLDGMSKDSVLEKLGKPPYQATLTGSQINGSMGPKPNLASSMADDATVEMWQYRVTDNRAAAVYFNEDGIVAEVIIYPTDVMY